jgi:hypothetical protein
MKDVGKHAIRLSVQVYPLKVRKIKSRWTEHKQRRRKWMTPDQAANELGDLSLGELVQNYAGTIVAP